MARTKKRFNATENAAAEQTSLPENRRAALYARLSVELMGRKSESIENQLELMHRFVSGRTEFTEVFEYADKGYSGTDFDEVR